MTSNDLKNMQDPVVRSQYSQEYQYVPEEQFTQPPPGGKQPQYKGKMPLNFAAEYEGSESPVTRQQVQQPAPPHHQPALQHREQLHADQEIQNYYAENPQYDLPQAPNQQYPYNGDQVPNQQYPYNVDQVPNQQYPHISDQVPNQQYPYHSDQVPNEQYPYGGDQGESGQDGEGYRAVSKRDDTKDYIDMNKRSLRGDVGSAKSYGRMFHRKKDYDFGRAPLPVQHAKTKGKPLPGERLHGQSVFCCF